jgi:uncharacterized protein YktB (UPF0637 family)
LAAGGLFSVFYIVNALHQKEAEIRQEFNLSSDQAQRYIQRTSDVMKAEVYCRKPSDGGKRHPCASRA